MSQRQPRKCLLHEPADECLRTDFHELRRLENQVCFTDGSFDTENPSRTTEPVLIADLSCIHIVFDRLEWNRNSVRGNDRFQMCPDVLVQGCETVRKVIMGIQSNLPRVRLQTECAQRAC